MLIYSLTHSDVEALSRYVLQWKNCDNLISSLFLSSSRVPATLIHRHMIQEYATTRLFAGRMTIATTQLQNIVIHFLHQLNFHVTLREFTINNFWWVFRRCNTHDSIAVLRNKIKRSIFPLRGSLPLIFML